MASRANLMEFLEDEAGLCDGAAVAAENAEQRWEAEQKAHMFREAANLLNPAPSAEAAHLFAAAVESLITCDSLFHAIRNDWTDPRHECREGYAAVREGLVALEGISMLVQTLEKALELSYTSSAAQDSQLTDVMTDLDTARREAEHVRGHALPQTVVFSWETEKGAQ